jgi:uncharacterized protein YjbJ (UPF0337 family)/uncharacterized membrane protein YtjA (UPF0391 family)
MGPTLHNAVLLFVVDAVAKSTGAFTTADVALRDARVLFWVFLAVLAISLLISACRAQPEQGPSFDQMSQRRIRMDWDRIAGSWTQMKGKLREQWGKLTDDDVAQLDGSREQLEGKIQERYGYGKDQARQEIDDWSRRLG